MIWWQVVMWQQMRKVWNNYEYLMNSITLVTIISIKLTYRVSTMHACYRTIISLNSIVYTVGKVPFSRFSVPAVHWMCQLSNRQWLVAKGCWSITSTLVSHGMACFHQSMRSKGRGGYISFLQGQPVFQASSGVTNIPPRAAITWHAEHNTFLLIWG